MQLSSKFIFTAFLLSLVWGFVFWDGLMSMEAIWRRSETFAHGYFILPIVVWLFWRDRAFLLNSQTETSWLALPFIIGSLLVYLFSYAADINVLSQLSAVTALISLIWLLLGNRLAWHYKFPLAYLVFLVPMGENLIPDLQDITAWFTVSFLKLQGIPVYQDGLYIHIPNGLFEVAVACSGIRYLIASLAVGTLFAYLSYNSLKKQILFFLFALALPIIANGIRAYLIVIIAHYSDMEYATGADHLVYGWFFFGLVIMLMFWIGGKFADPELSNEEAKSLALKANTKESFSLMVVISAIVLMVASQGIKVSIPVIDSPLSTEPAITNFSNYSHSNWGIIFKESLRQSHIKMSNDVEVYRAVYANKQRSGELINSANKIYNANHWTQIERKTLSIDNHQANYLLLRNISGQERVIVYWYQVNQQILLNANMVKLNQAIQLFTNPSSTSELVAFSTMVDKSADESLATIKKIVKLASSKFININKELME